MVVVNPQGPEKRWNYTLWSVICGVLAVVVVVLAASYQVWLALVPGAIMIWGCVQYGIWAVRGRPGK